MTRRVGLFMPAGCALGRLLSEPLAAHPDLRVATFDIGLPEGGAATIDGQRLTWDGTDLAALDMAVVHGFAYQSPVIPGEAGDADWSLWQARYPAEQQKYSFLYSLFSRMNAAGVVMANPPETLLHGFSRPGVLLRLAAAGLAVPAWLVANDDAAAQAFCAGRTVVWRTTTGRCAWQIFRDRQRLDLLRPDKPPVLLAEVVEGPLLRALVVDGRVAMALAQSAPDGTGHDERLEAMRAVEPSEATCAALVSAAAAVGARWSMLTYVETGRGPVIYDLDPDPLLHELPPTFAARGAEALAAMLAGAPPEAVPASGTIEERPALFQRRMLRILFEMEATKHADRAGG